MKSPYELKFIDGSCYVDVNAEGNLMQFAETVAVNRGIPVKIHPTVESAIAWLEAKATEKGKG